MKERKKKLLQKVMTVLLMAALMFGTVSEAMHLTVYAQESNSTGTDTKPEIDDLDETQPENDEDTETEDKTGTGAGADEDADTDSDEDVDVDKDADKDIADADDVKAPEDDSIQPDISPSSTPLPSPSQSSSPSPSPSPSQSPSPSPSPAAADAERTRMMMARSSNVQAAEVEINGTKIAYATFEEAWQAVANAGSDAVTLKLMDDYTLTDDQTNRNADLNLTLDLAGHTLTYTGDTSGAICLMNGGTLTVTDSGSGGTARCNSNGAFFCVHNNGSLIIKGGRIESGKSHPIIEVRNANLAVEGGSIVKLGEGACIDDGSKQPGQVVISGGIIRGDDNLLTLFSSDSRVTITGEPTLEKAGSGDGCMIYTSSTINAAGYTGSSKVRINWGGSLAEGTVVVAGSTDMEKFDFYNHYRYEDKRYFGLRAKDGNLVVEPAAFKVSLKKDDALWVGSGKTMTLKWQNDLTYVFGMTEADGVYTLPKYNEPDFYFCLYEDDADTGLVLRDDMRAVERNYYTVTFVDGETVLSEQIILAGQEAAEPDPAPEKENMTFEGWTLDGVPFDPKSETISKKTVLQARWAGGQGEADKEVSQGENTPSMNIATPLDELVNMCLTEAEKQQMLTGVDIKIRLTVEDAGNSVSDADRESVRAALDGYQVGQYLDISLFKEIGADSVQIHKLDNGNIRITIEIPDSLKNTDGTKTRDFAIIRVHEGASAFLEDLDDSDDTITIETNLFSTYALVYKDSVKGDGGNTGDNGNTGGSGNTESGGSSGSTGGSGSAGDGGSSTPGGAGGSADTPAGNVGGNNIVNNAGSGAENNAENGNNAGSSNNSGTPSQTKDQEPRTGDATPFEIWATLAMISGLAYLMLYFMDSTHGMTEESKKELTARIIRWARQGGRFRRLAALTAIFGLLVYYHSIGKISSDKLFDKTSSSMVN